MLTPFGFDCAVQRKFDIYGASTNDLWRIWPRIALETTHTSSAIEITVYQVPNLGHRYQDILSHSEQGSPQHSIIISGKALQSGFSVKL
jgi:hypothetical protein